MTARDKMRNAPKLKVRIKNMVLSLSNNIWVCVNLLFARKKKNVCPLQLHYCSAWQICQMHKKDYLMCFKGVAHMWECIMLPNVIYFTHYNGSAFDFDFIAQPFFFKEISNISWNSTIPMQWTGNCAWM